MTQQVLYDTATGVILQWQDTAAFGYPVDPAGTAVLAVTPTEWAEQSSPWHVASGVLTSGTAPAVAPTLAQEATAAIMAGLTIALSGTMTLTDTVFPTDPTTQAKLNAVSTVVLKTGAFPGGTTSYPMKDAAGIWHIFTISQYEAVATAIAAYVAPLDLIIDGNPLNATALPSNHVSLTV